MSATATGPLLSSLSRRARRDVARAKVREIHRRHRAAAKLYAAGLPAERQAMRRITLEARREARTAILGTMGRRIDLLPLLDLTRADGYAAWALVDPRKPIGNMQDTLNGTVCGNPDHRRGIPYENGYCLHVGTYPYIAKQHTGCPSAMPALPPEVRSLITPALGRRTSFVGVLYQPTEWTPRAPDAKPDPALVVEWLDRRGEYYALAVWGGDRGAIMEFVS